MTLVRRLSWLRVVALASIVLGASLASAVILPLDLMARNYQAQIEKAQKDGKWAEVVKISNAFVEFIKKYDDNNPKLKEYAPKAYAAKAEGHAKQGLYAAAANDFRDAYAYKAEQAYFDKVMTMERKDLAQDEWYALRQAFDRNRLGLKKEIVTLAEKKAKLTQEYLNKASLTNDDMAKLQAALKDLDAQKTKLEKTLADAHQAYEKESEPFRKDDLVFTAAQQEKLGAHARQLAEMADKIGAFENEVRKDLVKIAEKHDFSWDGLKDSLKKVADLEEKILANQKNLLAGKVPLPKDWYTKKEAMDKLVKELDETMAKLEKAFMDAKIFSKLTPDQKREYMDLFAKLRKTREEVQANLKKVDELIKKDEDAKFVYGDINKDGKVDKADLQAMLRLVFRLPIGAPVFPFPLWRPQPLVKAADLDGDGRITMADFDLLNQMVNGNRKFFPVDPKHPVGDMNGDGTFDNSDLSLLARYIIDPSKYAKFFGKIADVNGDGKVTWDDLAALVRKIDAVKIPVPGTNASGTVGIATAPVAVDPVAAPVTDPTTQPTTGTGEAAGGLMDNMN